MFPERGPASRPALVFYNVFTVRYGVSLLIRVDQLPSAALTPGP